MLEKMFEKLGFSEKETKIYLSMLKLSQATPASIARDSGINRTTAYDILDLLLKKGLVSKYKKSSKTYFNAMGPEKLMGYLDREKEEQNKIIEKQKEMVSKRLPELISMQGFYSQNKPKIQFFEGEKGLREAYETSLDVKIKEHIAYANVEEMHKTLPNFFPEYYKRRVSAKIFMKTIMPKNIISEIRSKQNEKEMRVSKFLPGSASFSPETIIFDNKVLVVSWKEKMAFIIESQEYADFQKQMFNIMWDNLD